MDKQQWKKISRILEVALFQTPERRTTYVQNLCSGDTELQATVKELLESVEASDLLLDEHLQKNDQLLNDLTLHLEQENTAGSLVDTNLDQWHILELLGCGGMGEVYKAERCNSDIHQKGALKILRQGLNTAENIGRFRLEKQILASLHHPNIASLIDGGISESGLPYLVMEYVDGLPIDQYCDTKRLSIEERLGLFKKVCQAVQHAHKNLIVHRDLKPENILVSEDGHVKILDFGIAKLLDADLYELSAIETRKSVRLMSLEYAAPEQISAETVTTSTDVYSLGIFLYELLAGVQPFNFDDKKFSAIEQIVLHEEPSTTARKLRGLPENRLTTIADNRQSARGKLITQLAGDLDAIMLKALRKEPEKRYESVSQFVEDVDLYLHDKPVRARMGTTKYHISKFFKRHAKGIATAAAFLAIIITLTAFYTFQLAEERNTAQMEAQKSAEVTQFLTNLFEANHPDIVQGNMPTARDLLDVGVQRIDTSFVDNPVLRAEMQALLGNLYFVINKHEDARPLLEESLTLAAENDDIATQVEALRTLSHLFGQASDKGKSLAMLQRALQLLESEGQAPGLLHAKMTIETQLTFTALNRNDEALRLTKIALEMAREASYLSPEAMFYYLKARGTQLRRAGYFGKAESIFKEILELNLPPDQAAKRRFEVHESLLYIAYYRGDQETAFALHDRLLKEVDELFPQMHGARTHLYDIISRSLIRFGHLDEAEEIMRKGLAIQAEIYPSKRRFHLAGTHLRLGFLLRDTERYPEALQHFEEARNSFKNLYDQNYHQYFQTTADMGDVLRREGHYTKSETLLSNALELSRNSSEANPTSSTIVQLSLAKLRLNQNRPTDALEILRETLNNRHQVWNKDKRLIQEIFTLRARVLAGLGSIKEAKASYDRAIAMGDQICLFRGIAWQKLLTEHAHFLAKNADPEASLAAERAFKANQKLYGPVHPDTHRAENLLASLNTQ